MAKKLSEETGSQNVSSADRDAERKLIEAARNGDKKAFGGLVMLHQKRLFRTVVLLTGGRDSALDIVQEAFVRAWKNLDRFESERPFYPWIARIARNAAINFLKKNSREQSLDDLESYSAEIPDRGPDPLDKLIAKENDRRFMDAVRRLPEQFRAVFILRMVEKLSYDEIAKELGISSGTVDSRLYRAREKLLEMFKDDIG